MMDGDDASSSSCACCGPAATARCSGMLPFPSSFLPPPLFHCGCCILLYPPLSCSLKTLDVYSFASVRLDESDFCSTDITGATYACCCRGRPCRGGGPEPDADAVLLAFVYVRLEVSSVAWGLFLPQDG